MQVFQVKFVETENTHELRTHEFRNNELRDLSLWEKDNELRWFQG